MIFYINIVSIMQIYVLLFPLGVGTDKGKQKEVFYADQ
jgi:hypothetical protein